MIDIKIKVSYIFISLNYQNLTFLRNIRVKFQVLLEFWTYYYPSPEKIFLEIHSITKYSLHYCCIMKAILAHCLWAFFLYLSQFFFFDLKEDIQRNNRSFISEAKDISIVSTWLKRSILMSLFFSFIYFLDCFAIKNSKVIEILVFIALLLRA